MSCCVKYEAEGKEASFDSCSFFLAYQHVSFTPTAESLALAVNECLYGRDVVPLSPAVREANLWNQVAPRDCPWGSTRIDVKKLH